MNQIASPLLALALSLVPIFCWAAESQPRAGDNDAAQLKAVQDERNKVLTKLVEILTAEYKVGTVGISEVTSAENELCDALLDSTDDSEKRVALLTKEVDKASDLFKSTENAHNFGSGGTVTEADVLRAKSLLLGLITKLLREGNKRRPTMTDPKGK